MYHLSQLTQQFPQVDRVEMVAQGYGVWLVWAQELPRSIPETMRSFGGVEAATTKQQSLWLFFSDHALDACAQLYQWFHRSQARVQIRVFAARLNFGQEIVYNLGIEQRINELFVDPPRDFEIRVHVKVKELIGTKTGIRMEQPATAVLPQDKMWFLLRASEEFHFVPRLAWIFIVSPGQVAGEGSREKNWQRQVQELQERSARSGFKYNWHQDNMFLVEIQGVRQLKNWCLELLRIFQGQHSGKYLSCYLVGLEAGDLDVDKGVPQVMLPDWNQLEPDQVYLPLKDILGLGLRVSIPKDSNDLRNKKISDLFPVQLSAQHEEEMEGKLEVYLPPDLIRGSYPPCFYCGLKGHMPKDCPTRSLIAQDHLRDQLAGIDLPEINNALKSLGQELASQKSWDELLQGSSPSRLIFRAIFTLNYPVQYRTLRLIWRSRGTAWPEGLRQLAESEDEPGWNVLENFRQKNTEFVRNKLHRMSLKNPGNFQPKTLLGFLALEENNHRAAEEYWTKAQKAKPTALHQGYHLYLKARLHEVGGNWIQAFSEYQDVLKTLPRMLEAKYRQGVCLVKSGRVDQALSIFLDLIRQDPHYFNQILIDPELSPGHQHLMTSLYPVWRDQKREADKAARTLEELSRRVDTWFSEEHQYRENFMTRINGLQELVSRENYAAFTGLVQGIRDLQSDFKQAVEQEIHRLQQEHEKLQKRLQDIKAQLTWFPFKRYLASKFHQIQAETEYLLNRVQGLELTKPQDFRQGTQYMERARECMALLEKKLKTLKTFREGMLFLYIMAKDFVWILLAVLAGSVLLVPLIAYAGLAQEMDWALSIVEERRALLQVGVMAMLILSLGAAAVRTTLRFERLKSRYLGLRD